MYGSQRRLNYLFHRFTLAPTLSCLCNHEVRPREEDRKTAMHAKHLPRPTV